ncbi:MAG TPA: hypothetical protein VEQ60_12295 [Longimicrobium sp.]|nr:hypothetical protein [Longimicrobium sp.]
MSTTRFNLPLAIALVAALSASPALAQGKGNSGGNGRDRVEQHDRDRDDDDDDRRDRVRRDRDDDRRSEPRFERRGSNTQQRVPPGWCRGRGNPHNTAANCRYNSSRSAWERYDDRDRRWESRTTYERGTNDRYDSRNGGSYDSAHRDFHYSHDRQCRERAAQRPTDLRWQVQVRQECAARHQEFHRRWGIAHR